MVCDIRLIKAVSDVDPRYWGPGTVKKSLCLDTGLTKKSHPAQALKFSCRATSCRMSSLPHSFFVWRLSQPPARKVNTCPPFSVALDLVCGVLWFMVMFVVRVWWKFVGEMSAVWNRVIYKQVRSGSGQWCRQQQGLGWVLELKICGWEWSTEPYRLGVPELRAAFRGFYGPHSASTGLYLFICLVDGLKGFFNSWALILGFLISLCLLLTVFAKNDRLMIQIVLLSQCIDLLLLLKYTDGSSSFLSFHFLQN